MKTRPCLLSVAGTTPAVITETLYGLYRRGVVHGDVRIITTSHGREKLAPLFGPNGEVAKFNRAWSTRWRLEPQYLEVITRTRRNTWQQIEQEELADLRSADDNECAANAIVKAVRRLTEPGQGPLFASVAGGRKTMGMYLQQAMSWFARSNDELSHVLVPPEYEMGPGARDFFFPDPQDPSQHGIIDYAELPFVRIRHLAHETLPRDKSYSELVKLNEAYLEEFASPSATLNIVWQGHRRRLEVPGIGEYPLTGVPLGLYLFLVNFANVGAGQSMFLFSDAFKHREALARALELAEPRVTKATQGRGLAALALAPSTGCWPEGWVTETDAKNKRVGDLVAGFGKLRQRIPKDKNFAARSRGKRDDVGYGFWVDIDPERVRYPGGDPRLSP